MSLLLCLIIYNDIYSNVQKLANCQIVTTVYKLAIYDSLEALTSFWIIITSLLF